MLEKTNLVSTRNSTPEDKNFILATWLRGLYYGDSWFREIRKDIFMENYHKVIENILARPGVSVQVACLKDDPEVILGYSVSRGNTLDWVFIKAAWRGIGIAKSLLPKDLNVVTHLTKPGLSILKKKLPEVVFNPFA